MSALLYRYFELVLTISLVVVFAPASSAIAIAPQAAAEKQEEDSKSSDQDEDKEDDDKKGGQEDLDKAFQRKISASSTRDLDKVADLCESAIEKGLDDEAKEQATVLWATVLFDHANLLDNEIMVNGKLNTRWRVLRSRAISRLEQAIELRPKKVDALILLAELHSLTGGDKEAAREAVEKAIGLLTDDKQKLAEALHVRSRLAEDEDTRIADLSQAVKIDPTNFQALMDRATYYLENDKTEEAMADFRSGAKVDKKNIANFIEISEALRSKLLFKESVEILSLGIDSNPEEVELYLQRGQGNLAADNQDEALKDLTKVLDLDRQNVVALSLRARVYLIQEDFDNALRDANELIQQKPNDSQGLQLRSLVYRSDSKLDKAIEDIESLLEIEPTNFDYKYDLALLFQGNDQPSKAIPIFDEIIRRLPDSAQGQILRSRGDAYLAQGKHQRAIDDYELALEIIEEHADSELNGIPAGAADAVKAGLLNNLSWVLSTSPDDDVRDGKKAVELATEASELTDYKAAYILSTLAAGYAETGDFESARKWASKAVELAESDEQRVGLQDELDAYKKDKEWRELEDVENDKKEADENKSGDKESENKKSDDGDSDDKDSDEKDSDDESDEDESDESDDDI